MGNERRRPGKNPTGESSHRPPARHRLPAGTFLSVAQSPMVRHERTGRSGGRPRRGGEGFRGGVGMPEPESISGGSGISQTAPALVMERCFAHKNPEVCGGFQGHEIRNGITPAPEAFRHPLMPLGESAGLGDPPGAVTLPAALTPASAGAGEASTVPDAVRIRSG